MMIRLIDGLILNFNFIIFIL